MAVLTSTMFRIYTAMANSIILWTAKLLKEPANRGDVLGDDALYLKRAWKLKLTFYKGEPLDIELPTSVDLKVVEADVPCAVIRPLA